MEKKDLHIIHEDGDMGGSGFNVTTMQEHTSAQALNDILMPKKPKKEQKEER